jgi:lyso-ornithine lipid O-acyltransferase
MTSVKAGLRLFLLVFACLIAVLIQTPLLAFYRGPASYLVPMVWHKAARRIFGVKMIVEGKPVRGKQVIYVSNHLSYIDIPVLGSLVYASFVGRGDVAKWPGWGYFGRMQQTVYISRDRHEIIEARNSIQERIAERKNLVIFAEGTSSDGSKILPFKSGFFSLALENPTGRPLLVQPVTISLLEVDGKPVSDVARDLYAWHGDMTLPPHIWRLAGLKGAKVLVRFHAPRDAAEYSDRKALCADCHNDVTRGLEALAQAA